jgi:hypothetical protein
MYWIYSMTARWLRRIVFIKRHKISVAGFILFDISVFVCSTFYSIVFVEEILHAADWFFSSKVQHETK